MRGTTWAWGSDLHTCAAIKAQAQKTIPQVQPWHNPGYTVTTPSSVFELRISSKPKNQKRLTRYWASEF